MSLTILSVGYPLATISPDAVGGAEQVLSQQGNWSEEKLRSLVGKGERYIRLQEKLPVHLTYFTLAVDEHGQLKHFDDLYGHHAKVRAALGLNG